MIAAIVRGGMVVNTVYVESVETFDNPAWADELAGATVVNVADGEAVGPGYSFDEGADPRFQPPPGPPEEPPSPADVLGELSAVAADDTKTMDQKLVDIIAILAAAGGGG